MNSSNTCKPKKKVLLFPMTWPKIEDVGGHEAPLEASLSVPSFVVPKLWSTLL